MPQSNLNFSFRSVLNNALGPMFGGKEGKTLLTTRGGGFSLLNITAGAVLIGAAGPIRPGKLIIIAAGTAASWAINDSATVAGAAAANLVWGAAFGAASVTVGTVVDLDFPLTSGFILTVPTTGIAAISFTQ